MNELDELFGDGSLTRDEFNAKLAEKANTIKLANLKSGSYVDKAKYDKLSNDFETYKTNNDVSKYADYDTIKTELEQLKTEKAEQALMKEVETAKVNEQFREFVLTKAKAMVTDKKDFKACLAEYLEANPQFTEQKSNGFFKKSSSVDLNGGEGKTTANKKMNEFIRNRGKV